jgi:hypothetical protein
MQSGLNESIKHNDLRGLIAPLVSIDQYKSKVGKDENVAVVAFKIKDIDPAQDLSQFIESGYDCLDVDVSPGPDSDGIYTVFVELERNSKLFETIDSMLNDIKQVDNDLEGWAFLAYETDGVLAWNEENFNANVIVDSYEYVMKHNPEAKAISERMKFLNKY